MTDELSQLLNSIAKQITDQFGSRCPDRNRLCATCIAWEAYDTLKELLEED